MGAERTAQPGHLADPAGLSAGMSLAAEPGPERAAILMVDDDPRNLFALEHALADLDADLVGAQNGTEALRQVLQRDFAAVILDVHMPGLDGYEVAEMMRKRERTKVVPIIFLSGVNKEERHIFRGYTAGAVDYVLKPVSPTVLKSKVGVFVELYNQRQSMIRQAAAKQRLLGEHIRVQEELRLTLERQSAILKVLPLALYSRDLSDPNGALRFHGSNVGDLFGFPPERFQAEPAFWQERIHPDDREKAVAAVAAMNAHPPQDSFEVEYRWMCADGEYRMVLDHGVRALASNGTEILGSWLDVTDRRQAEEQLTQMQKMEAIGQLSGGIAHDFNNMLTVVISSLDKLRELNADQPKALKRAETALQGALRCADLTRRLLTFARRQSLEQQPVHIESLVASMSDLLHRTLEDEITLEIHQGEGLWPALADAMQIEAALVNLVINARDAMPEGGRVTIGIANATLDGTGPNAAPAGDYVALSVSDTGTGMAAEVLGRAFEPFFTTKKVGKGTGLGLSIIYGFVRQQGGEVNIESAPGQGTTVTLYLPRALAAPMEQPVEIGDEPLPRARKGEVVLLVEDDREVRALGIGLLRDLGYKVLEAPDGAQALIILRDPKKRIDLLFSDIAMPGGYNGYELAAETALIRPDLPVLLTSAYAEFALAKKGKQGVTAPVLKKPYRDRDLARAIAGMLNHQPVADVAPAAAE